MNTSAELNNELRGQIVTLINGKKDTDDFVSHMQLQLLNLQSKLRDFGGPHAFDETPSHTYLRTTDYSIDPNDVELLLNFRVARGHNVQFSRALMCPGMPVPIACVPKYWPQVFWDTSIRSGRHTCVYQYCAHTDPYTGTCCYSYIG